jgi:hypothetical protein
MTEGDWDSCPDLDVLLSERGGISERKLILFGCACCRHHWEQFPNDACRSGVRAAERFADGLIDSRELRGRRSRILSKQPNLFWPEDYGCHTELAGYFATFDEAAAREFTARHPLEGIIDDNLARSKYEVASLLAANPVDASFGYEYEMSYHVHFLKDVVGNPCRPVVLEPDWATPTVLRLAEALYEGWCFDDMEILGDALEEAGCAAASVLAHCRNGEMHVRGCHVVDAILGKG